jgi:hypothetical protein
LSQIGLPATHHAQKRTKFHMAVKPPLIVACQDCLQPAGFAMRQLFVLAVALLAVGTYAAFYADRAVGTYPESQAAVVQPANESC